MEDLTEAQHNQNREILKTLTDNAPDKIANIIKSYDYDTDGDYISKEFHKSYKKDLQAVADYLQQLPTNYKLKDNLIKAIISRIDNLLLEKCRKCKDFFAVDKDDIPTISCSSCGQGAHEPCYKDLGTTLTEYPGLQYSCLRCVNFKKSGNKDAANSTLENVTILDSSTTHSHSPPFTQLNDINNITERDEDARPVCERYRRGVCPHGIRGQTLFNGNTCEYGHPKRCQRFCQYGTDIRDGCKEGRNCELLHPILCRYGLNYQLCTNLRCKFTHVKGTKRFKPREQFNDHENSYRNNEGERSYHQTDNQRYNTNNDDNPSQSNYHRLKPNDHERLQSSNDGERFYGRNEYQTYNNHRDHGRCTSQYETHTDDYERTRSNSKIVPQLDHPSQRRNQYENPNINPNNPTSNQPDLSFLPQLMEQIKEMQKEIKEVKAMYKPHPYTQQIPWYPTYSTQMASPQYLSQTRLATIPQPSHPATMPQSSEMSQMTQTQQ